MNLSQNPVTLIAYDLTSYTCCRLGSPCTSVSHGRSDCSRLVVMVGRLVTEGGVMSCCGLFGISRVWAIQSSFASPTLHHRNVFTLLVSPFERPPTKVFVCGGGPGIVCIECLFSRTPSRAPYRTPPACAKRATYSDPPPSR